MSALAAMPLAARPRRQGVEVCALVGAREVRLGRRRGLHLGNPHLCSPLRGASVREDHQALARVFIAATPHLVPPAIVP